MQLRGDSPTRTNYDWNIYKAEEGKDWKVYKYQTALSPESHYSTFETVGSHSILICFLEFSAPKQRRSSSSSPVLNVSCLCGEASKELQKTKRRSWKEHMFFNVFVPDQFSQLSSERDRMFLEIFDFGLSTRASPVCPHNSADE